MVVYIDYNLIGKKYFIQLKNKYPNIEFVTDLSRKTEIEVLIAMPKIVKNMNVNEYSNLKWIQYLMAGYDGINLKKFKENNIVFSSAQNVFSKSIAEDVFTKIFYFNRNVSHYIESKKNKIWSPIQEEFELTNSTALILGVGSIGRELAKKFKVFDMFIIGYRKKHLNEKNFDKIIVMESELNEALNIADYIIMALPLNDETRFMFDYEKFKIMKRSALFINVGRGETVKQKDMILALKQSIIRGAGIDVVYPEPLPSDSELWNLDNLYITPHNASSSNHMARRIYELIVMNLGRYLDNKTVKYIINN